MSVVGKLGTNFLVRLWHSDIMVDGCRTAVLSSGNVFREERALSYCLLGKKLTLFQRAYLKCCELRKYPLLRLFSRCLRRPAFLP